MGVAPQVTAKHHRPAAGRGTVGRSKRDMTQVGSRAVTHSTAGTGLTSLRRSAPECEMVEMGLPAKMARCPVTHSSPDSSTCEKCLASSLLTAARSNIAAAHHIVPQLMDRMSQRVMGSTLPLMKLDLSQYRNVAIDIDDTTGDFSSDLRQAAAVRHNLTVAEAFRRYPLSLYGLRGWPEFVQVDSGEWWHRPTFLDLESRGMLYWNQPVRPGARRVIEKIREAKEADGGRVIFLTARGPEFVETSRTWLIEKLGLSFEPEVHHSRSKQDFENFDLLIDDAPHHISNTIAESAPFGPRQTIFMAHAATVDAVPNHTLSPHAWSWSQVEEILGLA